MKLVSSDNLEFSRKFDILPMQDRGKVRARSGLCKLRGMVGARSGQGRVRQGLGKVKKPVRKELRQGKWGQGRGRVPSIS